MNVGKVVGETKYMGGMWMWKKEGRCVEGNEECRRGRVSVCEEEDE